MELPNSDLQVRVFTPKEDMTFDSISNDILIGVA